MICRGGYGALHEATAGGARVLAGPASRNFGDQRARVERFAADSACELVESTAPEALAAQIGRALKAGKGSHGVKAPRWESLGPAGGAAGAAVTPARGRRPGPGGAVHVPLIGRANQRRAGCGRPQRRFPTARRARTASGNSPERSPTTCGASSRTETVKSSSVKVLLNFTQPIEL
ncbi:hypothetical protein [Streptomyces sp. NPDC001678]|uniref:hypothetical protein n=1 Tax=Streptomyces sp. NPDC001678 TaxID=3364599 RepID=UPI0036C17C47